MSSFQLLPEYSPVLISCHHLMVRVFILASVFLCKVQIKTRFVSSGDEVIVDLCDDNIWQRPAESPVNNVLTPQRVVLLKSICAYLCSETMEGKKKFGDKLELHLSRLRRR